MLCTKQGWLGLHHCRDATLQCGAEEERRGQRKRKNIGRTNHGQIRKVRRKEWVNGVC
jgi:hypothetical protein